VHVVVGSSLRGGAGKSAAAKKAAAKKAAAAPHYLTSRLAELAAAHSNVTVVHLGAAEELPQHLDEYVKGLANGARLSGWGGVAVGSTATVQGCLDVLASAGADPADVRSDLFG
jgi:hypothetical protein